MFVGCFDFFNFAFKASFTFVLALYVLVVAYDFGL